MDGVIKRSIETFVSSRGWKCRLYQLDLNVSCLVAK